MDIQIELTTVGAWQVMGFHFYSGLLFGVLMSLLNITQERLRGLFSRSRGETTMLASPPS